MIFNGHYKKPFFDTEAKSISESWEVMPVSFDEILFDKVTHKPYFISYNDQHEQAVISQRESKIRKLIQSFESIALQKNPNPPSRKKCATQLVSEGLYDDEDLYSGFLNFVKALLSVRDGQIYIPNQEGNWAWLVNFVWDHHIQYWVVFLYTVNEYKRTELVFCANNRKLARKRKVFKNNWKTNSELQQSKDYYPLFMELLPKLKGRLMNSV